ncbi:MAG: TonB-dependent receptor [Steroidobacteraceae bacterium]
MSIRFARLGRSFGGSLAALLAVAVSVPIARAADPPPLETVIVSGAANVDSAITQAPTSTPLEATQPTATISQYFIQNNLPLTSNFSEIIGLSPSVQSVSPNGPGLLENQVLSIRGFVDGYYNVTFDGIPFQDSNDFTHHSTSYFMANDVGGVNIDYGPGTAATIGDATFCCTVENLSKNPLAVATLTPYMSFGSWHSQLYGAEYDTGKIDSLGDAAGYIDAESSSTDGELTNMGQQRKNILAKFEAPVAPDTVLTFVAMYNQIHQYVGVGATAAQIAEYGPTWGLNNNPDSQDYYGYNYDQIHTDFEYVGLQSKLDGWTLDNKLYTYAYYHTGHNGEDPNGETPNGTYWGADDVPGQLLTNNYRSWGDTFNAKYDLFFGDLKAGIWADRQSNERALPEVDETLNEAINPNGANWLTNGGPANYLINGGVPSNCPASAEPATPGATIVQPTAAELLGAYSCNGGRLLNQTLTTLQPYFMADWNVLPGLTLSPGVRYDHFERDVNAIVNVDDSEPQSYDNTFSATLPSLLAHYSITSTWAAYAQAAKGFMAPNEKYFNNGPSITLPGSTNLAPQETWSYQAGTTWQTERLSASGDVYYIHFGNEILSEKFGPDTIYFNAGGTNYKGVELNATYYAGMGFSLYTNGSINRAKVIENAQTDCATGSCTGGLWVPNAPNATLAYGVIYNQYGFYASLLNKRVGHTYGNPGESSPIPSYSVLNGALGYTFGGNLGWIKGASIKVDLNNLLNKTPIIALAGSTAWLGTPLYWTMPERSFDVTLQVPIS